MPIQDFSCKVSKRFFFTGKGHHKEGWCNISAVVGRKLDYLDAAKNVEDLKSPPGDHLEALSGDRKGFWSIRINDQWRIVFVWTDSGPSRLRL